jgi:Skp family chaperone for outer membrane proteins
MSRTLRNLLPFLAITALVSLSPRQQTPAIENAVGVVDFVKVFDAYPRAIEEGKRLDGVRKQLQEGFDRENKKLEDMHEQAKIHPKNSRERAQIEVDIDAGLRRLKGMADIADADMREQQEKRLVSAYEDIDAAVQAVAKEKGLKLVMRVHRDVGNDTTTGKLRLYESRVVWYSTAEMDLTAAVIKLLQVPGSGAKDGAAKPNDAGRQPDETK